MYKYGMRLRGYSIGCQPSGCIKHEDFENKENGYWSYIYYEFALKEEQMKMYDLDFLGIVNII